MKTNKNHVAPSVSREAIVAEARTWLGTPFRHQGRLKGVGVDCAGVVIGVATELEIPCNDVSGYGRIPSKGKFHTELSARLDPIQLSDVLPGDMMTFAWRGEAQHIAIVSTVGEHILLIHAWQEIGSCVENIFDPIWQQRLRGCWRYRILGGMS